MSTDYRFLAPVDKTTFLKAVKSCGLSVHVPLHRTQEDKSKICITCGEFYLWFYVDKTDLTEEIIHSSRCGSNYGAEQSILDVLSSELQIGYLSEHDEGYFVDEEEEEL